MQLVILFLVGAVIGFAVGYGTKKTKYNKAQPGKTSSKEEDTGKNNKNVKPR